MKTSPSIYLNENVAVRLAQLLKQRGISAIHTLHVNPPSLSDNQQLQYAAGYGYILLTHNRKHFRHLHNEWIYHGKKHAGILVVRHDTPERLAERIERFMKEIYPSLNLPFCTSPPQL